jgi:hypothetical protein
MGLSEISRSCRAVLVNPHFWPFGGLEMSRSRPYHRTFDVQWLISQHFFSLFPMNTTPKPQNPWKSVRFFSKKSKFSWQNTEISEIFMKLCWILMKLLKKMIFSKFRAAENNENLISKNLKFEEKIQNFYQENRRFSANCGFTRTALNIVL